MRRRDFIKISVGAAVSGPLTALAQQAVHMRRIGVLVNLGKDDPLGQARQKAFVQGLQALGWSEGRDVQIDTRWAGVTLINFANSRQNWLPSNRMSYLRRPALRCRR
jgi:hypothetical protein